MNVAETKMLRWMSVVTRKAKIRNKYITDSIHNVSFII